MKTLLIMLMTAMTVFASMASNHFFMLEDYYTSAVFTLVSLCAVTVAIGALSSKKWTMER